MAVLNCAIIDDIVMINDIGGISEYVTIRYENGAESNCAARFSGI